MKKEEILEKARAERSDEMERYINDKSRMWVILAMLLCLCVFSFTRLKDNQPVEDYVATLDIASAVGNFYSFKKTGSRHYLFQGIAFGAAGLVFAVIYFAKYFGV